jgi:hypothetical protein
VQCACEGGNVRGETGKRGKGVCDAVRITRERRREHDRGKRGGGGRMHVRVCERVHARMCACM